MKLTIVFLLILGSIFLLGCSQPQAEFCGNAVCAIGQENFQSCPADCQLNEPNSIAAKMVENQVSRPSDFAKSELIEFPNGYSLSSNKISNIMVSSDQICFSTGDTAGSFIIRVIDSSADTEKPVVKDVQLEAYGKTRYAKIGVICDDGLSLQQSLIGNNLNQQFTCMPDANIQSYRTFCVVMPMEE